MYFNQIVEVQNDEELEFFGGKRSKIEAKDLKN
jgi:hypothetical protein